MAWSADHLSRRLLGTSAPTLRAACGRLSRSARFGLLPLKDAALVRASRDNDRGSDHAWGGNHFVLGGSVVGRRIYSQYPSLAVNPDSGSELNPMETGRGRMIPTTSCDEYFAELALWLGVPASSLPLVLPNIGNFYSPGSTGPLGFLG